MQRNNSFRSNENEEGLVRYQPRRRRKNIWSSFVDHVIPQKNDDPREFVRKCILILAVLILVGSLIYIASYFAESKRNEQRTGAFKDMWSSAADATVDGSFEVGDAFPKDYLEKFWPLYEVNPDVSGWIEIPGTKVAYPVVQTGNNLDYDRVDFDGKTNQHGIPFLDYRVDLRKPSTNAVIYSHNMNDGQMFGELIGYKKLDYYKQHPMVRFDSVYGEGMYKIFGVVICKADDPEFLYHNYIEKKSDKDMEGFIKNIQQRSIINTTVDVKASDKLVTLSTCDYSFKDENGEETARFVVFARKVRDKEDEAVDVDHAKVNPSPVMPAEWYKYIEKLHQQELARQASLSEAESESSASEGDYAQLREEAAKWFTVAELANIKDENLASAIEQRKKEATSFLTPEELETLSPEKKEEIINDRVTNSTVYEEARQAIFAYAGLAWMTDVDVNNFAKQLARADKSQWNDLMNQRATQIESSSSSSSSSTESSSSAVNPGNTAEIYLDMSTMKLQVGDFAVLMAAVGGGDGSEVKWDTDNHTVATVAPDGTVEARRKGKATITATYAGKTATCKVEVSDEPVVEYYVELPSKMEVLVGQEITLTPNVKPEGGWDKGITWKLSGTKSAFDIATDETSCTLTGLTVGKAVEVMVSLRADPTKTATCKVTVVEPKLEISPTLSVKVGGGASIEVKSAPAGEELTWEIVNGGEYADVDGNGNVTGLAVGKATIRARAGRQNATCTVTVNEDASGGGGSGGGSSSESSSSESSSSESSSSESSSSEANSEATSSESDGGDAAGGGAEAENGAGGEAESESSST